MSRSPQALRRVTSWALVGSLLGLAAEAAIGVIVWPVDRFRLPLVAAAFVTFLAAVTMALLLAGQRWQRLDKFTQLHPGVMTGFIIGGAVALFVFVMFPSPVSLVLGLLVLGVFALVGWAVSKARDYIGL